MRISLIFSLLFYANVVWGTLTASAVFEINSAGSSTGACIFDAGVASPGTDRSQGTSAFKSGTDLASSNGTTNPCVVSSASAPFTTLDAGNSIIHTAGTNWTVQRSIIVSVDGSGNATLDRACGSAASLSGGTWKMGQACALGNSTSGISDDALLEMAVAGNTVYVKNGSYTPTAISLAAAGTAAAKIKVIGYNSSRTDSPTIASGTQPVIDFAANAMTFATHWELYNLTFTGTSAAGVTLGGVGRVFNSKFTNTSGTANRAALTHGNTSFALSRSEFVSTNGYAVVGPNTNGGSIMNSYIHDSVAGFRPSAASGGAYTILNTIFDTISGTAIDLSAGAYTGQMVVHNNTFWNSTPSGSSKAIDFAASTTALVTLTGNIFNGWVTGVNAAALFGTLSVKNNFFNNTTNRTNFTAGSDDLALDPGFVDAPNGNFKVGVNMQAASSIDYGATASTSYLDTGAVQRLEDYPAVTVVSNGTSFGNGSLTGTYVTVGTQSVAIGTLFGPSSTLTGTYAATERYTDLAGGTVLTSVGGWKYNSLSNNRTPTYVDVGAATNVKTGVSYGVGLTGTYTGSDRWTCPTAGQLLSSVSLKCDSTSTNLTGTYVDVGAATNVKHDVSYGVGLTGSYRGSDLWTAVSAGDLKHDVVAVQDGNVTGTYRGLDLFDVLATSNVASGFSYLANGNTLVGTLANQTISNVMCNSTGSSRNIRATGVVR